MITLIKEDCDNGILTCENCSWYVERDLSIGEDAGCIHPILYDDDGNIIDEVNDMIIECLDNPNQCVLYDARLNRR